MNKTYNKKTVGVVIGRFQIHTLHVGHQYLIDTASKENDELCILLGSTGGSLTKRNPLSFDVRKNMVTELYPHATIHEIVDSPAWSSNLDTLLAQSFDKDVHVRLYGSRDSFAKDYDGNYEVIIIEPKHAISGTEIRSQAIEPKDRESYRLGAIDSQKFRYPISYQTVDVAIIDRDSRKVLLGKKPHASRWCFPGGFVDPTDASLEQAALRELSEEVMNIKVDENLKYLGSVRVDDYRYRNEEDKILTSLFLTSYIEGTPLASDDLEDVRWFSYDDVDSVISETHKPLYQLFMTSLGS